MSQYIYSENTNLEKNWVRKSAAWLFPNDRGQKMTSVRVMETINSKSLFASAPIQQEKKYSKWKKIVSKQNQIRKNNTELEESGEI